MCVCLLLAGRDLQFLLLPIFLIPHTCPSSRQSSTRLSQYLSSSLKDTSSPECRLTLWNCCLRTNLPASLCILLVPVFLCLAPNLPSPSASGSLTSWLVVFFLHHAQQAPSVKQRSHTLICSFFMIPRPGLFNPCFLDTRCYLHSAPLHFGLVRLDLFF